MSFVSFFLLYAILGDLLFLKGCETRVNLSWRIFGRLIGFKDLRGILDHFDVRIFFCFLFQMPYKLVIFFLYKFDKKPGRKKNTTLSLIF